jgi:hypothetical protein
MFNPLPSPCMNVPPRGRGDVGCTSPRGRRDGQNDNKTWTHPIEPGTNILDLLHTRPPRVGGGLDVKGIPVSLDSRLRGNDGYAGMTGYGNDGVRQQG